MLDKFVVMEERKNSSLINQKQIDSVPYEMSADFECLRWNLPNCEYHLCCKSESAMEAFIAVDQRSAGVFFWFSKTAKKVGYN